MAARLGAVLLLGALGTACTKDGDEGYTALMRYAITDFRVAGISARLLAPGAVPAVGTEVELRAVVMHTGGEAPELEWLDCPSFGYEGQRVDMAGGATNVDCLGTPREIRLGRGERAVYRIRAPGQILPDRGGDGGWPIDAASGPSRDGGEPLPEPPDGEPPLVEFDDLTVFLRASQGDQVRYGRKSFLGLFLPFAAPPRVDSLTVDGEARGNEEQRPLTRAPGETVRIRFEAVNVAENRPVQWFVTGGSLSRHGLTYYTDVGSHDPTAGGEPFAVAQNNWKLPEAEGEQELVAVIGGGFGELPLVRVRVEVQR